MYRLFSCLILVVLIACTLPTEDISSRHVFTQKQIENAIMGEIGISRSAVVLQDWRYLGYTQDEVREFLNGFVWLKDVPGECEFRDCDEFAEYLKGNVRLFMKGIPFGTIKSMKHLANVFVDESLTVKIIDMKQASNVMMDVDPSALYMEVRI